MKVCEQCGLTAQDDETYCARCGSGHMKNDSQIVAKKQRVEVPKKQVPRQENVGLVIQEQETKEEKSTVNLKKVEQQKTATKKFGLFNKAPKDKINEQSDKDNKVEIETKNIGEIIQRENGEVVTVKEFIILYITFMIPVYGLFKIIKAALGGDNIKQSITNSIRASFVISLIMAVISLAIAAIIKLV